MSKLTSEIINRLVVYYSVLRELTIENQEYVLSNELSQYLNIDDSQVRRDLSILNCVGVRRKGYPVALLKHNIEHALGFKKKKQAFIIGAGNLGTALANFDNFEQYGFEVAALFDCDKNKIGKSVAGKNIYDIADLQKYAQKYDVNIAILTVPAQYAQETCNYLIKSGMKYIWNFSCVILKAPKDICIKSQNLIGEFLQFICLFEKDEAKKDEKQSVVKN